MRDRLKRITDLIKVVVGAALFALGFDLFLIPNELNGGGLTGLSMLIIHVIGWGSIGTITAIMNLPLFALAGLKIGKRFFFGSLLGMALCAVFLDLFTLLPVPETEPLIGALYGGVICGCGLGIIFTSGASTGGSDIIVRLLKLRYQNVPIGSITIAFDACIAILAGIVFQNIAVTLYSGVSIFIIGQVIDAVVYRFDYSKVVMIITKQHDEISHVIQSGLDRGVTFLQGEGAYSRTETKVVLTVVKKQQLADLKRLVAETDPNAFVIVQEAHQVLGDGFSRYSKDAL